MRLKPIAFLLLLIFLVGCVHEEVTKAKEIEISTNMEEYIQGDSIQLSLENSMPERIYFASCRYLILERMEDNWNPVSVKKCERSRIVHDLDPGKGINFTIETRQKAGEYLSPGIYRERFEVFFNCTDEKPENCEGKKTHYSNQFKVEKRELPELSEIIKVSIESNKDIYYPGDKMDIDVVVESLKDVGLVELEVKGILINCYRISEESEIDLKNGITRLNYSYDSSPSSNQTLVPKRYSVRAELFYTGKFEGIHYSRERIAHATKEIQIMTEENPL